jgi:hypothetical protein
MGTTANGQLVTFQVFDANAQKVDEFQTTFVELRGDSRENVIQRGIAAGRNPTSAETALPGSEDWLTRVLVADSPQKLAALVQQALTESDGDALTSAASRRVRYEKHFGNRREPSREVLTIADGDVVPGGEPRMNVRTFKILLSPAALDVDAQLRQEFIAAVDKLQR